MHTGFIFSGQQDTPKLLHTTNSSSTLHNTDYITRVPNMMTSKQFCPLLCPPWFHYFFPRSFTPRALSNLTIICWFGIALPDSYSWIIWGFSLIICKQAPFHYAVLYECNGEDIYWVREKDLPEQVETG